MIKSITEYKEEHKDYPILVLRMKIYDKPAHRCGYVGIPKTHRWHGKGYDHEMDINRDDVLVNHTDPIGTFLAANSHCVSIGYAAGVHGGLTYARGENDYPMEENPQGLWFFGFDAAHAHDYEDGGRSLEYMIAECRKLKKFLEENHNTKRVHKLKDGYKE